MPAASENAEKFTSRVETIATPYTTISNEP